MRGGESRLAPVTEATLQSDGPWLQRFADRLAALDRAALPPREAERLDTLRARVERERAPYVSGAWLHDPGLYLQLGPGAVLEAATVRRAGACDRLKYAAGRLEAVPEVLRAARVTMRNGRLAAGPQAEADWRAAMDSLRALPARLMECRDPDREADLVEADSLALGACRRFLRFLREETAVARQGADGR